MFIHVISMLTSSHGGFVCRGSAAWWVSGRGFCASLRFLQLERSPFFGGATLRAQCVSVEIFKGFVVQYLKMCHTSRDSAL